MFRTAANWVINRFAVDMDDPRVDAFLPYYVESEEDPYALSWVTVPDARIGKLREKVVTLAKAGDFDGACAVAESVFSDMQFVHMGYYAHEYLIDAFVEVLQPHNVGLDGLRETTAAFEKWFSSSPSSPFATASYALALFNTGFAYRGTDYVYETPAENFDRLEAFVEIATQTMEKTRAEHGGHWYWRYVDLILALVNQRGDQDHRERFDRALEAQPHSRSVWGQYVHQRMPRWHGDEDSYDLLAKETLALLDTPIGYQAFWQVISSVAEYDEWSQCEVRMPEDVAKIIIRDMEGDDQDAARCVVASMYAVLGDVEAVVERLAATAVFDEDYWFSAEDVDWYPAKYLRMHGNLPPRTVAKPAGGLRG